MARFLSEHPGRIPARKADLANEGKTHCKHGHGIEHQRLNTRGHKICWLCAREAVAKYKLANSDKIRARSRQAVRKRGVVVRRVSPTCPHGHLWANNTIIASSGRRRCRECCRIRNKTKMPSQQKVSLVLEGLSHGLTLNQMASSNSKRDVYRPHDGIKRIVGWGPLYNFFKAHPALGKKMKDASKKNAIINLRAAIKSVRIVAAPALMRNNGHDAFEAVQRATVEIWEDDRGDVQTLMWIDIGEGKLKLPDCSPEKAREYLKIHKRRPSVFGSYSLDASIGEESGMTWLDTKTDEDRLWA
jgi:hypothetical protein